MASADAIVARFRAAICGDDDDDPEMGPIFRELADSLAPDIARLATFLTAPQPEPLPSPPKTVREARARARRAKRELRRLEEAVARGDYIRRDAVISIFVYAFEVCCGRIRDGVRDARERHARGELRDRAAIVTFLEGVVKEAVALLEAPLGSIKAAPDQDQGRSPTK